MVKPLCRWTLRIVCLLSLPVASRAPAVDLGGEVDATVAGAYVWRGRVVNAEAVFQPSLTLRAGDLSANAWGTWNLTDVEDDADDSRVDLTLDYCLTHGRQIYSAGAVAYLYLDSGDDAPADTYEAFIGYALDVPLLPAATLYYDFGEADGLYASLGLAHSLELSDRVALDMALNAGGADEDYIRAVFGGDSELEGSALVDFTARVELAVQAGKRLEVAPGVRFMTLMDAEIRDAQRAAGEDTNRFLATLRMAYVF
jgi:hypothetical protein